MEGQELTALVAIDLSAAFDTVDHDVLLDVLNNIFGLKENTLDWINCYLRPRKFKVNISQVMQKKLMSSCQFPKVAYLDQFYTQSMPASLRKWSTMSRGPLIMMIK